MVNVNHFQSLSNTLVFCGVPIDDRGDKLLEEIGKHTDKIVTVSFDIETYTISLNDQPYPIMRPNSGFNELISNFNFDSILIESTTIGFIELLIVLKWFDTAEIETIEICYAEPENYKRRTNYMNDLGKHEFDLSSHSGGFKAIPGFAQAISSEEKAPLITILGFERSRLGHLMQEDEGAYISSILPIFGTPGYKVGWDKHSFIQNIDTLKDICSKPQFVSAHSPLDIYKMLVYIKESIDSDKILLAPFGTKPLSLGAAIFLINFRKNVILKYDHPTRKRGRSEGLADIHVFNVSRI